MTNSQFIRYVSHAPFALARERSLELHLMSQILTTGKILDIACGDGFFSSQLFCGKQVELYGIDHNPKEVARAKNIGIYKKVEVMDATKIKYPDSTFNTVFSNSSIEHIKDIGGVLEGIFRILAPGGNLYLTLPTSEFERYSFTATALDLLHLKYAFEVFCRFYNNFWNHHHAYSPTEWSNLFKNHGYVIQETIEYGSHRFCFLNDCMVPFGIFGKINMLLFKKWKILEPVWNRVNSQTLIQEPFKIKNEVNLQSGGLIYFHLTKPL